ncbi:hypothetical protein LNKW23_08390 [Paralimibaculum aggregatum]|uniref:HD Cas3-type domain-containing protein n=1 Tax=Paralimibaculum aggregatum TaxID=3036245 RepID=A0ABQ6LGS5_9RHOB|nr:type I-U CRISPR-associated helicase/endonuclease Cas3 [Limibaculum sp. NKW23]GMG81626.1 hypothetical protein LNKW23_08390 [Limibaculum sp. NKW23]
MTGLPSLDKRDFSAVFEAVHGHPPYAWQQRLLQEVAGSGGWPGGIAAPTGAGKTAVLDVALFHLALEAGKSPRRAPMRIVLAVDRRIIVDQAFERACRIRDALALATDETPLGRMAAWLRALSGDKPLHVAELRGGMPLERDWARRPDQPTILCTTVDQLGSRLLFRGYGVSNSMAPVHAGLLGCDALLILDEAHLSRAFEETLAAIARRRQAEGSLELPWRWTALTATPRAAASQLFALTDEERAEGPIARRLNARKEIELRQAGKGADAEAFADKAQALRKQLADRGQMAPVVAVVVNRVMLARQVFEALSQDADADAILLTGRVRPAERDDLIARWRDRLEGLIHDAARPLFVVATQCIEAGADFDFDAMVSQIAPLDALRQRFGRLARSGNRGDMAAPGIIVATKAETGKTATDPIYGRAPAETWKWLWDVAQQEGRKKVVDFGPDALDVLIESNPPGEGCTTPAPSAPPLREADLAAFAMTAPRPFPDPDPAPFLHGNFRDDAEIGLVWRGDIEAMLERLVHADARDDALAGLTELLALLPPRPAEALRLPLWAVQQWLAGGGAADKPLADVPASPDKAEDRGGERARVLRWRGRDDVAHVLPAKLRAGDVVILPAKCGGCDAFGWAPESTSPVSDIAGRAAAPYAGQRAALRLHPAVWPEGATPWAEIAVLLETGAGAAEMARATGLSGWREAAGVTLAQPYGNDPTVGVVLVAPKGLAEGQTPTEASLSATEGDEGLFGSEPLLLTDHACAVAAMACRHAKALGLKDDLVVTLATAGQWHDDGKADPRFQLWLRSIDGLPGDGPPIAKTAARASPARQRELRAAASLPRSWRHEVTSVRIAAARLTQGQAVADPDLLLWLIGTHHGHGRPFFPHDDDWDAHEMSLLDTPLPPAPGPDKLDFDWNGADWAGLMERLRARYGLWGLAFLEACLRLADHRASAGEVE